MAKVYLGRVVGAGLTTEGKPFSVYLVTGRSEGSQARRAVAYGDENRVAIEPLESVEDIKEKGGDPELLVYDAMRWDDRHLVASNGVQTSDIFGRGVFFGLKDHGYEPDEPIYTSRIGLLVPTDHAKKTNFGIVSRVGDTDEASTETFACRLEEGLATYIPTYRGRVERPIAPRIEHCLNEVPFDGLNPEELAEEFREMTDEGLFVASAAAVFDGGEWHAAASNRHSD